MKARILLAGLACLLAASPARAMTLEEALAAAYETNTDLAAALAQLRATAEGVPQAQSNWRPNVEANGGYSSNHSESHGPAGTRESHSDPLSVGVDVTQPLYRGGRTVAGIAQARAQLDAQRAFTLATEQQVLLSAVTSYVNVVRDQAVVALNANNEQVLGRQLEASNDRFRVGEITRTDVAQSESRVARAKANRIFAEGQLESSRAVFQQVVGVMPEALAKPEGHPPLPESLDQAITDATADNPTVLAAAHTERAAEKAVDLATGALLPSVSLVGSADRTYDSSSTTDRTDSRSARLSLSVPLYQQGAVTAQVRAAKQTANQRRIEVEQARRQIRATVISAWEGLKSAEAVSVATREEVRAADVALEGVRQEALVGSRTTLDILDSEQDLLDAQVRLVTAERDETVAAYGLLAAVGRLTAADLHLPVTLHDVESYIKQADGKWWGLD